MKEKKKMKIKEVKKEEVFSKMMKKEMPKMKKK